MSVKSNKIELSVEFIVRRRDPWGCHVHFVSRQK